MFAESDLNAFVSTSARLVGAAVSASWSRCRLTVVALLATALVAVFLAGCGSEMSLGRDLDKKGDLAGAVTVYERVLAKAPGDVDALSGLAVDLMLLGKYSEALPIQEKVVTINPKDVQTRIELAFNYLNHQGQPAKAVDYLRQAVILEPSAKNLTFLAQALIQAGDLTVAEQTLHRALVADPKYPHEYIVLLSFLDSQGRTDDAAKLREQARANGVDVTSVK